jgi:hypothetical protein
MLVTLYVTAHQFPESVTQKAGPTPGLAFFVLITASADANVVDTKAPIAVDVPFPAAITQPGTICFHFADVDPAFTRVSLLKFSTSESNAFNLETVAICSLLDALGIMLLCLL